MQIVKSLFAPLAGKIETSLCGVISILISADQTNPHQEAKKRPVAWSQKRQAVEMFTLRGTK